MPRNPNNPRLPAHIRFERLIQRSDGDGCWLWIGNWCGPKRKPYGQFFDKKEYRAHRYAYARAYGPIPDGMSVCHRCDTPLCVRPDHLFLGTPADNSRDMAEKGRAASGSRHGTHTKPESRKRGEEHWNRRLVSADVLEMRRLVSTGLSTMVVSRRYGVNWSTVKRVVTRKTWAHIP